MRVVLICLVALTAAHRASACAACACGDATITALGTEKPYEGRLRLALSSDWREWVDDGNRMDAAVLTATVAYAPAPWLIVGASLPVASRSMNGSFTFGLADADVDVRALILREARHQLAITGSVLAPTTTPLFDKKGALLVDDAQVGYGDLGALAGLFYGYTAAPVALFASVRGLLSAPVTMGIAPGPALLADVTGQWMPIENVAIVVGADGRAALAGTAPGGPFGEGVVVDATSGLLFRTGDVVLDILARVPAYQAVPAGEHEGSSITAGVAVDLR